MTSYERYVKTIQGQPVDFVPRLPILMQFAAEFIGSNYAAFASDYRALVEANLRCCEFFGIDQFNTMSDPYRETQGFGAEVIYETNSVPRIIVPPLADTKDLRLLKSPDPLRSERMFDRVQAVRAYRREAGNRYSIMGWVEGPAAEAADVRGVTEFLIDLLDDEVFAGELMDRCVDVAIPFAKVQVESGADTIGIGDAIASQVSWETYERLILPREIRLVQALKAMGAYVRLHICGDITHLLPGVARLGVDVLDVDSMVDLTHARRIMGPKVALMGNLNPATVVRHGPRELIRRGLEACYAAAGNPYMAGAGCETPPGTPSEFLLALCEPLAYRP